jgi:hypothetical protein
MLLIGFDDHGQGVPPNEAADATLEFEVARIRGFVGCRDRIDVRRIDRSRDWDSSLAQPVTESLEEVGGSFRALLLDHILKGVQPFTGFLRIRIGLRLRSGVVFAHCLIIPGVGPLSLLMATMEQVND